MRLLILSADDCTKYFRNFSCRFTISGKKLIHLLEIAAEAMKITKEKGHTVEANIVVCHLPRLNETAPDYEETIKKLFDESRDTWWHDAMKSSSDECKLQIQPK